MADRNRVDVEILGQKYAIRTEAAPEYVRQLAAYVEERVREIQGTGAAQDSVKLLALAALYIADELFRLREEHNAADRDTGARLDALAGLLASVASPRP